jgi:hypothetical protein
MGDTHALRAGYLPLLEEVGKMLVAIGSSTFSVTSLLLIDSSD